ncbi:phasin family protein [Clostridium sp. WILCCON 0269]|uniref:Phasin family protein n=1 Tax=Candidatus Clostridium eludens TaxID=3381663 RepID=A0ABW8SI66_9CLOT
MINELRNLFLAGVGSAAYTYEKAAKLIQEMVQKGRITVDEGKQLSEELKKTALAKREQIKPITKNELTSILASMNFATKDDISAINERLNKIENKLNNDD